MMLYDFASRCDFFYSKRYDQHSYFEFNGCQQQRERVLWQPQDPSDLEPETPNCRPGAMPVGELDEFYTDHDDPDLSKHLLAACPKAIAHLAGLEGVR